MQCVMCASVDPKDLIFKVKDRLNVSKKEYNVVKCRKCKTIMLDPFPAETEVNELYNDNYNFKLDSNPRSLASIIKNLEWELFYKRAYKRSYLIMKKVSGKERFSLLDIGCGSGLRLKVFKDQGCEVEGNEMSDSCVKYIKELGIKVHEGKIENVSNLNKKYDIVSMFALFEHLPDPKLVIEKAKSLLAKEGLLVIQVPVTDSLQYKLLGESSPMVRDMPRHIFIPSAEGLNIFMEKLNFSLIKMFPVSFIESAAFFALGLFPDVSTPSTYGQKGVSKFFRRLAGWLAALIFGIPVAVAEKLSEIGPENIFVFKMKEIRNEK